MSSTNQPTQTTTQVLSPEQKQLFNAALPGVQQFAAAPPPTAYPGSSVAPLTAAQTQGQQDILAAAPKAGQIADWATGGIQQTTANPLPTSLNIFNDPGIWNPNNNQGIADAIAAAQRPTWQALTETALPAIRTGEVTAGGFGGSRGQLGEGVATGRAFRTASDQASKIAEDEYAANLAAVNSRYATNLGAGVTQRGQDIGAYEAAPTFQTAEFVPGQAEFAVGTAQQQQQQNELNDLIAKYYYNQPGVAPFLQSQQILALLGGLPGGGVTSTGNLPQGPTAGKVASGAIAGAAAGAPFGPIGAGIGAVGGGVLPFAFPT